MQKISLQKKSFFNSIGLDMNNVPHELQIKTSSMSNTLPNENVNFLQNEDLTIPEVKHFRLKNLIGTYNPIYNDKTWIEIFSENEKSDEIIKQYYNNPNYYYKELRKLDQVSVNGGNTLVLYEDNGKFFIKDGIARLSLMMIKYLLEMSRASSKEERAIINKQYILAAEVRAIPKDRDIMYLIHMLTQIYGNKLRFKKVNNTNECNYLMKYEDKKIEIKSKNDLENFLKNSYLPKEYKSLERFKIKLENFVKIGIDYKNNDNQFDQFLVMGKIFPNYEIFTKYYMKIVKNNMQDKIYEKLDLEDISYDQILKKLIKIVKQEEIGMGRKSIKKDDENLKESVVIDEKVNTTAEKKVSKKTTKKALAEEKTAKSVKKKDIEDKADAKKEVKKTTKKDEKAKEEEELKKKIGTSQDLATNQLSDINSNIEMTYYKLKSEEAKMFDIANSVNVQLNIDRINDDAINLNINSIKQNTITLKMKISELEDITALKDLNELLKDLNKIGNDKTITTEYIEEMKSLFMICFNKNAQKMLTDAKLKKLDFQRKEIENEKCSFFSKLIGKAKLKQAKLDNISLKEQLILSESQFSSGSYITLEDGVSDLYAYIRTEVEDMSPEDSSASEIKMYIKNLESNVQMNSMIDRAKLERKIREKIEQQRNLPQLVLSKEKRKLFSKAQINMMQEKNNELKRVIQINRANSLKKQNTGLIPTIGNIKSTKSVKRFINGLNEIDISIKNQSIEA